MKVILPLSCLGADGIKVSVDKIIWADSTIMFRLVSFANNRIEQPIFFTI